jgi:hypothetical protein
MHQKTLMKKLSSTILMISIHPEKTNPVYGEGSIHVSIDDEGGGPFIKISQSDDEISEGVVRLDFEELQMVYEVATSLISQPGLKK